MRPKSEGPMGLGRTRKLGAQVAQRGCTFGNSGYAYPVLNGTMGFGHRTKASQCRPMRFTLKSASEQQKLWVFA